MKTTIRGIMSRLFLGVFVVAALAMHSEAKAECTAMTATAQGQPLMCERGEYNGAHYFELYTTGALGNISGDDFQVTNQYTEGGLQIVLIRLGDIWVPAEVTYTTHLGPLFADPNGYVPIGTDGGFGQVNIRFNPCFVTRTCGPTPLSGSITFPGTTSSSSSSEESEEEKLDERYESTLPLSSTYQGSDQIGDRKDGCGFTQYGAWDCW